MTKKQQILEILKKQYEDQHPEVVVRDVLETQKVLPLLEKLVNGLEFVRPISGVDYFTDEEKNAWVSMIHSMIRVPIDGKNGVQGKQGEKGEKGQRGADGKDGKDGRTPVRGVDYFTAQDVSKIVGMAVDIMKNELDIDGVITPRIDELKKTLPNTDSILVSILKDPRLRMLLHGGGGGASSTVFIDDEVVAGSGTSWTLSGTPISGSLKLYALGQRLKLTTDYTITGTAITTVLSWNAGELLADYRTA